MDRDSAEMGIESIPDFVPERTAPVIDRATAAADPSLSRTAVEQPVSASTIHSSGPAAQAEIEKLASATVTLPVLKIPQKEDERARLWLLRNDRLFIAGTLFIGVTLLFYHWVRLSRWGAEPIEIDRLPERRANYRIDINRATKYELAALDGIGPALALRIVEDREKNGPFRSPEEIIRVNGIGPRIFERLKPHLQASSDFPVPNKIAPQRKR